MKNFKQILLTILVLTSIISCKKDDNSSPDTLNKEAISAKWVVDGTSAYESFEFNKSGNYIIVENVKKSTNEKTVHFGTYKIQDDKTLVLADFGKIEISELKESSIKFSVMLDSQPSTKISVNATKKAELTNSARTELLCKTWEMVSIDGENVVGTEMELTVLFSAAGTYFVSYANPISGNDGGLAQWTWKDTSEEYLCYSWAGEPTCDGDNEVAITVTADNLKIVEEDLEYILKPVVNAKSGKAVQSVNLSNEKLNQGFFKK